MGFSGFIEQRLIPKFSIFRGGTTPNLHLIPAVAAAQQFSGSLDAVQREAIYLPF